MGEEAFLQAAVEGNENQVKMSFVSIKNPIDLKAALQIAAGRGHVGIVRFLVEQGVDAHEDQELALRFAAWFGHADVVHYLLGLKANIHAGNPSALECAEKRNHDWVKQIMLTTGEAESSVRMPVWITQWFKWLKQ